MFLVSHFSKSLFFRAFTKENQKHLFIPVSGNWKLTNQKNIKFHLVIC